MTTGVCPRQPGSSRSCFYLDPSFVGLFHSKLRVTPRGVKPLLAGLNQIGSVVQRAEIRNQRLDIRVGEFPGERRHLSFDAVLDNSA